MHDADTDVSSKSPVSKLTSSQIENIIDDNSNAYRRDIIRTSWKVHTQASLAGIGLGIVFGGIIGALTVASTKLVGVPFTAIKSMLLPITGTFSVFGMGLGLAAFSNVGRTTGAAVGTERVEDRKKLLLEPTCGRENAVRYHSTADAKDTFWNRLIPLTKGSRRIFNPVAGIVLAAGGLGVGGLLEATGRANAFIESVFPSIAKAFEHTGSATLMEPAVTCMTLTACALNGAYFALDNGTIAANATDFMAKILNSKASGQKEFMVELDNTKNAALQPETILSRPRSSLQKEPVIFVNTSSTLISPIGAYAGEKPGKHMRKLAEQKFNAMKMSRETTIN